MSNENPAIENATHNEMEDGLDICLGLKSLENYPTNIRSFPINNGSLVVAVDQTGRAIALTFVLRQ